MTTFSFTRISLILLLLGFFLNACQNEKPPLLKIGDHQISLKDFRQEIKPLKTELVQLPAEQQKLLLRQALSQLIDQELLLAEAQRRDISINNLELQQEMDELRGNYTNAEYMEILRGSGQNPERWMESLRIRLLSKKVAGIITEGKIAINRHQIEEYYLQHLEKYRRPEQLQARQMLLASEEEAIRLRTRFLAGETFAALAKRYSTSPDRENGGDLGLFAAGQFPPEFDAVLFNLTPGRISPPVKSPYGFHLFLVDKRVKEGVLPLTEVEAEIHQELRSAEEAQLYRQWLQEQREKTEIRIDWEQLDKLHFNKAE